MTYTTEALQEARRQIESIVHKLQETIKTLQAKEQPERCKSQLTLASRRIAALEISLALIDSELEKYRT